MSQLIEDLIQFSHVTTEPMQKEDVDLNENVKKVIEDLELDITQKQASIAIEPLPKVKGYSRQLQQLFQNLIANALKYSKSNEPPAIHIGARMINEGGTNFNVLEVKDNGIGFDQKYESRIFQMFSRLHGQNQYSGSGIGLSIVKKIVENHQGRVQAESAPGVGATFRIYLPVE